MLITPSPLSCSVRPSISVRKIGILRRLGQLVGRELVLVLVVVARVAARDERLLAQLVEHLAVVLGELEVDHGVLLRAPTVPSRTPRVRALRYHISTGCSRMKPWPPSTCTPSSAIHMHFSAA